MLKSPTELEVSQSLLSFLLLLLLVQFECNLGGQIQTLLLSKQ